MWFWCGLFWLLQRLKLSKELRQTSNYRLWWRYNQNTSGTWIIFHKKIYWHTEKSYLMFVMILIISCKIDWKLHIILCLEFEIWILFKDGHHVSFGSYQNQLWYMPTLHISREICENENKQDWSDQI